MIKCKICGMEKETPRQMHGHLIRWHYDEYKANEFNMSAITSGAVKKEPVKSKKKKEPEAPAGLRPLNKNNRYELEAIKEGYYFIDDEENCYTIEELKEEGVI